MTERPCEWDVDPSGLCSDWDTRSQEVRQAALDMASSFLWAATGRRFGVCTLTVRPCQDEKTRQEYLAFPVRAGGQSFTYPYLDNGTWKNCGCGPSCCCRAQCRIALRGPVASVDEVVVDGMDVDPYSYRVDVQHGTYWLVRLDGQCWPTCPDVEDPDSFVVTYGRGTPLPPSLKTATSLLACEMAKAIDSSGECKLPARVQTLTRQGVTVEAEPEDPANGFTGLPEVDRVIRVLNPSQRRNRPVFLSPDVPEDNDFITVVSPGP